MHKYLPLLCLAILLFSCQNTQKADGKIVKTDIDREIKMQNTPEKLADYYTAIFNADQNARDAATLAQEQYGYNSSEHIAAERVLSKTDSLNLAKIEKLFALHGYPTTDKVGHIGAAAPWTVIHHAGDLGDRLHNWKIIKEGYKIGEIDDNALSLYLNRTYEYINNGERLRMQGTFKTKEQVDSLLTLLELEL